MYVQVRRTPQPVSGFLERFYPEEEGPRAYCCVRYMPAEFNAKVGGGCKQFYAFMGGRAHIRGKMTPPTPGLRSQACANIFQLIKTRFLPGAFPSTGRGSGLCCIDGLGRLWSNARSPLRASWAARKRGRSRNLMTWISTCFVVCGTRSLGVVWKGVRSS